MRRALRWLGIGAATVLLATVAAVGWLAATESGMRWALARAVSASGGSLRWDAAAGTLMSGLQIRGLVFDNQRATLTLQQLQLEWQPWRLLDATLVLDDVAINGLRYVARGEAGTPLTPAALQQLLFTLPLTLEVKALQAKDLTLATPAGELALEHVSAAVELTGDQLQLAGIDLRQGSNSVTGAVKLASGLQLDATLAWRTVQQQRELAGVLTLGGTLQRIDLQHQLTAPLLLSSSGSVVPGLFAGESLALDLQHRAAVQDLASVGQPELNVGGTLTTRGTPADLAITGSLDLTQSPFAPVALTLDLHYGSGNIGINTLALDSSELALTTTGTLQIAPLAAALDWTLTRLQPGERWPAVQLENANGSGSVQLSTGANGYNGMFTLNQFAGRLNGYAISVSGSASLLDSQLAALLLQAQSGDNTLTIEGPVTDVLDLHWQLEAPALAQLSPALRGSVQAEGDISGTRAAPAFAAAVQAKALVLASGDTSFRLDSAALNLTGTAAAHRLTAEFSAPFDNAAFSVRGTADANGWRGSLTRALIDSRYGRWQLQAPAALAYVDGSVSVDQHCWSLQDTNVCLQATKPGDEGLDLELALTNAPLAWLNNGAEAAADKPAGLQELQDALALNLPDGLRAEGALDLQLALQNLQGTQAAAVDVVLDLQDVVLQLTRKQEADSDAAADIERFALAVNRSELHYAERRWQADFDLGVADAQRGGTGLGNTSGSVSLADNGELGGSIAASFTDLNWLETLVPDLSQPSGRLDATLTIGGTRSEPVLQGHAQLQEGNVDLPAWGVEVRGAAFSLAPLADGSWQLVGGASSGEGMVSLLASVREPLSADRSVEAQLQGERVQALNTSYAAVTVSPDLRLHYNTSAIALEGSLVVDSAEVDLETVFGEAGGKAVPLSSDVTIVSGSKVPQSATAGTPVPVTLDLVLKLGDAVQVRGYKLDAKLTGELRLQQVPGRSLLVYGQLDIPSGSYEIYNQRLSTRDGNLAFFGNPANPSLDLRAFRTTNTAEVGVQLSGSLNSIEGELYSTPLLPADEILALLVTGKSLSAVNAQENTALIGAIASLGLGGGSGFGQGITERVTSTLGLESLSLGGGDTLEDSALGLGKFLTPDLLMRYKVGLFDRQSVLGIEYTLNEHLKLKVESGISQSVEFSYTIEKD